MGNFDDYKPDNGNGAFTGPKMVEIINAVEKTSSKGNPMVVIKVRLNNSEKTITHYVVKNDWFNQNMTRIFDCFKIERGNFTFLEWIGCIGAVNIIEDEEGYLKIKNFYTPEAAQKAGLAWVGAVPELQKVADLLNNDSTPVDETDLPF